MQRVLLETLARSTGTLDLLSDLTLDAVDHLSALPGKLAPRVCRASYSGSGGIQDDATMLHFLGRFAENALRAGGPVAQTN